jgi:hypothetical protein
MIKCPEAINKESDGEKPLEKAEFAITEEWKSRGGRCPS